MNPLRYLTVAFVYAATLIGAAHPLFHWMESGSVDSVIDYMVALAAQLSQRTT